VASEVERLLTVADVANRLSVKPSWVYAKVEANELPHVKVGRFVRFETSSLESYIERQRQGPGA
jgi:excisionase family DNA binding protein